MNKIKPELLAPAGDLERLKIACIYGADAVYLGGELFGLRANAINFSLAEIKEGVLFAHKLNKKVYVTVNIILHNEESEQLLNYLKELEKIGVDAIIASDLTVIKKTLEHTNLEVHVSTQQSTLNVEAVKFWKKQGVKRIILARELSFQDIKEIKEKVNIQLETFIHGAMCASMSGRCVLSNYLTLRDANRGGCSQICRWDFNLLNNDLENITAEKKFTFCTKDLMMLEHIPDLIDLGITSLKIEGRMRSVYYLATVVGIYRRVIDEYMHDSKNYKYNKQYEKVLSRCANRESIPQFFKTNCSSNYQYYLGREEKTNQDFLGYIKEYNEKTKFATIEQRNYFKKGDIVEVFGYDIKPFKITIDEIFEEGKLIDVVRHPLQIVQLKINKLVKPHYLIRRFDKTNII